MRHFLQSRVFTIVKTNIFGVMKICTLLFQKGHCYSRMVAGEIYVHMWARLLNNKLLGLIEFLPHLISVVYRGLLWEQLPNLVVDAVENVPIFEHWSLYFQLDGSEHHYRTVTRKFLNKNWPDRWIRCGRPIEWPPQSPHLTPLYFFCGAR